MTITTAKWPAGLKLAPLAVAAMLVSTSCRAEWKFTPRVDLRETFSDNVNNQVGDAARSAWVSEVAPSFDFYEKSSRLKLIAQGDWHTYAYSHDDLPSVNANNHNYRGTGQAVVVEDYVYVDASASSSRQATSALGPTTDNPFSSTNTTQIRTWSISPYLQHRFSAMTTVLARYTRDSVTGSTFGYGNSVADTGTVQYNSGSSNGLVNWGLSSTRQDLHSQFSGDSSSENDLANVRWNLYRTFALTASVGYDDYDFSALKDHNGGRSWSGGFVWAPSSRTNVALSLGHRYFGKTGMLNANYRTQHTVWSLTYGDDVTTSRAQFLLPAAVDTAAMLDGLFAAAYPDPNLRQQAISSYIAANGLPAQLATSINYLSNRYFRDKRLQGSMTFDGAHSTLTMALFRDERNALSIANTDNILLGTNQFTLNDNVRQVGANLNFDYRLSSRTTASASTYLSRSKSISTQTASNNQELHLRLSRRFNSKINGSVELRRISGRFDYNNSGSYHENAIAAALTVLY